MLGSTGVLARSTFRAVDETSQPIDVLVSVTRDGPATLGAQIEDQLRRAIRDGSLIRVNGTDGYVEIMPEAGTGRDAPPGP